ncbi:MAG: hypothetical protein JWM80_1348 [Cyanobacteria bacterium RYN_339]|nr:hypothetical protein [Cyanobacteria bacterium RYN_339]
MTTVGNNPANSTIYTPPGSGGVKLNVGTPKEGAALGKDINKLVGTGLQSELDPTTIQSRMALPTLKRGASGPEVEELQRQLQGVAPDLVADGHFGPATEAAVHAYQKQHFLTDDGVVGPETHAALTLRDDVMAMEGLVGEIPVGLAMTSGGQYGPEFQVRVDNYRTLLADAREQLTHIRPGATAARQEYAKQIAFCEQALEVRLHPDRFPGEIPLALANGAESAGVAVGGAATGPVAGPAVAPQPLAPERPQEDGEEAIFFDLEKLVGLAAAGHLNEKSTEFQLSVIRCLTANGDSNTHAAAAATLARNLLVKHPSEAMARQIMDATQEGWGGKVVYDMCNQLSTSELKRIGPVPLMALRTHPKIEGNYSDGIYDRDVIKHLEPLIEQASVQRLSS